MLRENKKNFLIDLFFVVAVAALIYFVFKFLAAYTLPFVVGLIIAALIQKPTSFVSKYTRVPKGICSLILVVITYLLVGTALSLLGYLIYSIGAKIASTLPYIINEVSETWKIVFENAKEIMNNLPGFAQNSAQDLVSGLIVDAGKAITGWIPKFAANVALSTPEYIIITIVTVVSSCYFAKDFDVIKAFFTKILKPSHIELLSDIKEIAYTNIFKLLKSYVIIMFITFVELSIGLLIMGVDNAILLALIIAFVDILPVLGCGTVLIPWGIIAIIQSNYLLGVGVLLLYFVILIVRNIIEPKIIGDQVGMHPLITLLTIFVGLRFLGVLGMFILPIFTIIVIQLYKNGKLGFLSINS